MNQRYSLSAAGIEKAAAKYFNSPKRIISIKPLTPVRTQRVFLCRFNGNDFLVIKHATEDEYENQRIAFELGIKTPRIIGEFMPDGNKKNKPRSGLFLQEYIKGAKTLADIIYERKIDPVPLFQRSVELLADIHNSLKDFKKKKKYSLVPFDRKRIKDQLEERINSRLLVLLNILLKRHKYRTKAKEWLEIINSFDYKSAVDLISGSRIRSVIVRWDYKPDNILISNEKKVFSIDWRKTGVGNPWLDLGFLLSDLSDSQRNRIMDHYLKTQKKKDKKQVNVSSKKAREKVKAACKIVQVIHASSNAKFILESKKGSVYEYKRLAYHLDRLGKI